MFKTRLRKAVNKSPKQRVEEECLRRGWKRADLAKAVGMNPKILTNVLTGGNRYKLGWLKMEDVLGLPLISTPDEFAARQCAAKIREIAREICTRAGGQLAAMDILGAEFQAITSKLGISLIALVLDGASDSPLWKSGDTDALFSAELAAAGAGEFDSARMFQGCWICFYFAQESRFAKTLSVLKEGLKTRALLDHARLFAIESEDGTWVQYWPATAERF